MVNFINFLTANPHLIGLEVNYEMDGSFCIEKDSELDNFFEEIKFKLVAWSEKEEEVGTKITLAYINLIRIPSNYRLSPTLASNYDMYDAMEEADCSDLQYVKKVLENKYYNNKFGITDALHKSDLYHISEIFTNENYRNAKLGTLFLELLPELIKNYCGDEDGLLSLRICPIDVPNGKTRLEAYQMLEKFYKRNNFEICTNEIAVKRF